MLTWLDGRNSSSFGLVAWNGNKLELHDRRRRRGERAAGDGADQLRGRGAERASSASGEPGRDDDAARSRAVEYAFFDAAAGSYVARYAVDEAAPAISNVQATAKSDGTATISWNTDEPADSRVDYGTTPSSLSLSRATLHW